VKGFVRISVEDTGAGIPPDVLSHIFEPFYSTKREGEGTGLGLAICDGIVRAAGGRIEVHSKVGQGTRFDVLLPRAAEKK
jgi:signal transduction histidine kinase